MLIKDIWKERASHVVEKQLPEQEAMPEFVFEFLRARFGTDAVAYEWGYNLHDACSRYNHDPKIGLFFGILIGEVILFSALKEPSFKNSSINIQRQLTSSETIYILIYDINP